MPELSNEWTYVASLGLVILMKIICFILGYLTIRLGYRLIASGAKGEFKFSAQLGGVKTDLASVSPGLLFVLLGVLLIGYAMYVEKGVSMEKTQPEPPPEVVTPRSIESPFVGMGKESEDAKQ